MENEFHVVWVIPGFADGVEDDTCIPATLLLLEEFAKVQGLTVSVIALHYPFKEEPYQLFGFNVYPLNGRNNRFRRKYLRKKFERTFDGIQKEKEVDLIHSFWLNEAAFFASNTGLKFEIPHICNLMGQDARVGNKMVKKISPKTVFVTISSFHKKMFYENYNVNSKVVHLGVEKSNTSSEKVIDIICVGSLIDLKNTVDCIKLVELLIGDFPNVKCLIVGDGPNYKKLKNEVYSRKLNKHITLSGKVSRRESLKLISQSKVLFHPSSYESFGMILAEALAAQTHVLANKVGLAFEENLISTYDSLIEASKKASILLRKDKLPEQKIYSVEQTAVNYLDNIYPQIINNLKYSSPSFLAKKNDNA